MAKLPAEQQKQLADLERLRDAPDDGDDDGAIWVRNADGHETRLTGARADNWLQRNGYTEAAGDASTPGAPLTPAGKGKGKGTPAGGTPAAGRKPAARTSSGTAPDDDADIPGEDGEELDTDEPARTGRRAFF